MHQTQVSFISINVLNDDQKMEAPTVMCLLSELYCWNVKRLDAFQTINECNVACLSFSLTIECPLCVTCHMPTMLLTVCALPSVLNSAE